MPAAYAHTLFGNKVLEKLNPDIQKIIKENIDLYYIGLFGPDILFYYKPLSKNDISSLGYAIHQQDAYDLFMHMKKVIRTSPNKEASLSYVCGFINHFILDSECHGFIGKMEKELKLSHATIEADFERQLMQNESIHASSKHLLEHIHYQKYMAELIAPVFQLSPQDIHKSIKGQQFFLELLRCPGNVKKNILSIGMKCIHVYDSMFGLIVQDQPHPQCIDSTHTLVTYLDQSVNLAVKHIHEYINHLDNDELSNRFHYNFE